MVYLVLLVSVLVVLFFFVPKRAAIILSGFAAIILAIALGIYWHDLQEVKLYDQVGVTLSVDEEYCPADKALKTTIENQSAETVYRVHFYFNVFREGYSTAVSRSYRNEVQVDKILEPGKQHVTCVALPDIDEEIPRQDLRFELQRKRVWFEPPVL